MKIIQKNTRKKKILIKCFFSNSRIIFENLNKKEKKSKEANLF